MITVKKIRARLISALFYVMLLIISVGVVEVVLSIRAAHYEAVDKRSNAIFEKIINLPRMNHAKTHEDGFGKQ